MEGVTILEAAKMLGYTKNAVKYQVAKLPDNLTSKDENGVIHIKPAGLAVLREIMGSKQPANNHTTTSKKTGETTSENNNEQCLYNALLQTVETLRKQLEEKDKQLLKASEEKDKLLKLLDQQQILNAKQIEATKELPEKSTDQKRKFKLFRRVMRSE